MTFTGFYKKTRQERIDILHSSNIIDTPTKELLTNNTNLDIDIAGKMAENHIGTFSLPLGIVPHIKINEKNYTVPMVTEEPSVIAACSNASKIISSNSGFKTIIHDRKMIGQVAIFDTPNIDAAIENIDKNKEKILELANNAHPSIVKRGGGATEISQKIITEQNNTFLVVYLTVDVQEAMGANILNNMLESIKPYLEKLSQGTALMGILSNYATSSLVTTLCNIPITAINKNEIEAEKIAKKIALSSLFAKADPYRAATHNKGIFNGIDAVVIATGNDWRAIEAACHTYACKNNKYEGLSEWIYDEKNKILKGSLTLPMPVATVGGSIGLNPTVKIAHNILKNPNAKELASIIVSIGLAQNFAALKALVSVGIQKGHMKLHSKSLALLAGANNEEVELVADLLQKEKYMNLETAKNILSNIRKNKL